MHPLFHHPSKNGIEWHSGLVFKSKKNPISQKTDRIITLYKLVWAYPNITIETTIEIKTIVTIVPNATVDFSK